MTRFVYLTDSHVGAEALGYRQQPDYPGRMLELTAALEEWLRRHPEVEFVLHGGDMVDAPTPAAIAQAKMLFHFSVPVYLCLGNHDLRTRDALQRWQQMAPGFFPEETPIYSIWREDCCLHIVPNQWSDLPYYWPDEGEAQFTAAQLSDLRVSLARSLELPHILCMHGPALAVPPEQTGFGEPYHPPVPELERDLLALARRTPQLQLVLGGHTHMNAHAARDALHLMTCSSFCEAPFEFKLIEVEPGLLSVSTHNLMHHVSFRPRYDFERTYVQGRPCDRGFVRGAAHDSDTI